MYAFLYDSSSFIHLMTEVNPFHRLQLFLREAVALEELLPKIIDYDTAGLLPPVPLGPPGIAAPTQLGPPGVAAPTQLGPPGVAVPTQLGPPGVAAPTQLGPPGMAAPTQLGGMNPMQQFPPAGPPPGPERVRS